MDLGFIGFIPGILMLVNGAMGSITGLVFNHVLMVAAMLGSSSVVLSMGLVAIISGYNSLFFSLNSSNWS